ncbi:serine hydrolase domain-containing protein [uncultured Aquimarina sp.]|uniref:serine hydrolase domain-containing protein n=1 Tax=uncultured Aquimarina sp. TaxID=575652 RepID=UPI002628CC08|nr:serine hydrolase domain-containing protein [uncultured Aquimarina sp.]
MNKTIIALSIFIFVVACGQKNNSEKKNTKSNSKIKDSLTTQIDKINENGKIVGFSVAIVDSTGILYNEGFGFADSMTQKIYSTQTVQPIASVSKTLIGLSLFKAKEMGKLNLDDPINKYLPFTVSNPNFPEIPITVRQLAIHTSSINDSDSFWESDYILIEKDHKKGTGIPEYFNEPKTKLSLSDFLKSLLTEKGDLNNGESYSRNKPSAKFDYSNVGSNLCALVIESATGIPYKTFTTKYILEPLQMNSSSWTTKNIESKKRSTLYATNTQIMANYTTVGFPSSGLITSSTDLGKYLSELIKGYSGNGSLLTKESYDEFFKKQLTKNQLPQGVDANSGIFMDYSKRGIGYNGYDSGLMAYMYFNPESLIGKIVLINTDTDFDEEVRPTLDEIYNVLGEYETKFK